MRALNETSEAQQAGDTIVPDRAAFRREACQLEYSTSIRSLPQRLRQGGPVPLPVLAQGGHITWQGEPRNSDGVL